jgi:hypothetical protein
MEDGRVVKLSGCGAMGGWAIGLYDEVLGCCAAIFISLGQARRAGTFSRSLHVSGGQETSHLLSGHAGTHCHHPTPAEPRQPPRYQTALPPFSLAPTRPQVARHARQKESRGSSSLRTQGSISFTRAPM